MLIPRQAVPALQVPTLAHGAFDLATDAAAIDFAMAKNYPARGEYTGVV